MERKIGEIFEYKGKWYQCVEFPFSESEYYCDGCSISAAECVDFICDPGAREDNKRVIFKKLEKVGEPYKFGRKLMQKYNIYAKPYLSDDYGYIYIPGRDNEVISIESNKPKKI